MSLKTNSESASIAASYNFTIHYFDIAANKFVKFNGSPVTLEEWEGSSRS